MKRRAPAAIPSDSVSSDIPRNLSAPPVRSFCRTFIKLYAKRVEHCASFLFQRSASNTLPPLPPSRSPLRLRPGSCALSARCRRPASPFPTFARRRNFSCARPLQRKRYIISPPAFRPRVSRVQGVFSGASYFPLLILAPAVHAPTMHADFARACAASPHELDAKLELLQQLGYASRYSYAEDDTLISEKDPYSLDTDRWVQTEYNWALTEAADPPAGIPDFFDGAFSLLCHAT